ncbi:MAG: hypothetical protein ACOX62_08385 [Christensenellales bacterium]
MALSSDNVRKVFSDHGDETKEALRGQRAIQESDFLLALDVITSPDSVVLSETTRDGKPVLEFSKHTGDRFVAITVVSDKHMDLSILTMYAGKRKGDLATALDKQVPNNTPEATSGTVPNESIPESGTDGQVLFSVRDSAGRDLSPEQQEFFKDSQVRDEQGNLLVVYHGTPNNFTVFSKELRGTNNKTVAGTKYFFAGDIETAESYSPYHVLKNLAVKMPGTFSLQDAEAAKGKGGVMPLYLLIKNPLVADLADYNWSEHREAGDALLDYIDEAERNGNDGLIFYNVPDNNLRPGECTSTIYLFKEPEQAKSIYNTTPTSDPDIRYSFRGYAPPMYSRLQMEIEALKDDAKLGADSVIAYLRKRGVKAEEIRWSGIQAFLQGKKSVTKAELMEFVQGNELRVDVSSAAPIVFDINEAEETITLSDHRSDWMHVVPGDDGRYYDEVSGLEFDSFDEAIESAERAEAELREGEEYPETRYRAMPAYEKPPARPMDGYYRAIRLC